MFEKRQGRGFVVGIRQEKEDIIRAKKEKKEAAIMLVEVRLDLRTRREHRTCTNIHAHTHARWATAARSCRPTVPRGGWLVGCSSGCSGNGGKQSAGKNKLCCRCRLADRRAVSGLAAARGARTAGAAQAVNSWSSARLIVGPPLVTAAWDAELVCVRCRVHSQVAQLRLVSPPPSLPFCMVSRP